MKDNNLINFRSFVSSSSRNQDLEKILFSSRNSVNDEHVLHKLSGITNTKHIQDICFEKLNLGGSYGSCNSDRIINVVYPSCFSNLLSFSGILLHEISHLFDKNINVIRACDALEDYIGKNVSLGVRTRLSSYDVYNVCREVVADLSSFLCLLSVSGLSFDKLCKYYIPIRLGLVRSLRSIFNNDSMLFDDVFVSLFNYSCSLFSNIYSAGILDVVSSVVDKEKK